MRPSLYTLFPLLALCGCESKEDVAGRVTFALYEHDVVCRDGICADASGVTVAPDAQLAADAIISGEASRYRPDGIYVYAELLRQNGATGVLELDLAPGGQAPVAAYSEWVRGERVFHGQTPRGEARLGAGGDRRGRFALRFVDPGADGVAGTADDAVRILANGEYGLRALPSAPVLPPAQPGDGWDWSEGIDIDLWVPDETDFTVDPGVDPSADTGCGGAEPSSDSGASGCDGSSTSDGSGSGASASGCDGGGGSSGDAAAAGCDGGGGGGGCAGGGGGGCAGDMQPTPATGKQKAAQHTRGPKRLAPLFLLGFVQLVRRPPRRR